MNQPLQFPILKGMKHLKPLFSLLGYIGVALLATSCTALSKRPVTSYPKIGQVVTVPAFKAAQVADKTTYTLRVVFVLDGVELNFSEDATFYFYKKMGDTTPLYTFHARDLAVMAQTTGCTSEQIKSLDNGLSSDTLFCNKSLDLSEVHYFLAKRPKEKDRSATSYIITSIEGDVKSISIAFN